MKRFLAFFLCQCLVCLTVILPASARQTVVVTLFDGFTPQMMALTETPNFDQLKSDGSWSDHFVPVFPTLSLTNHTSYITGCLPQNHGILNNKFYDPERGLYDHSTDADWRTGCSTLFEVVEQQGLQAAVLGYTSRNSSTEGPRASHISKEQSYEDYPSDPERADQVVALLDQPDDDRPELIVAYFAGPDGAAHYQGYDSEETILAVQHSDEIVGRLRSKLEQLSANESVALFIGTDHGMMNVSSMLNIRRILNRHKIKAKTASSGTNAFIYLEDAQTTDQALQQLRGHDAFDVYGKGNYPDYVHLGDGPRAPDILLVGKPPYAVEDPDLFPAWTKWLGVTSFWPDTLPLLGALHATHGYDPAMPEMHGIFYAWGSQIKKGQELDEVQIINIHPTVLTLMALDVNGDVDGKPDGRMILE